MLPNTALFLFIIALTSVSSQTFQYSRGWTNGKRDGHRKNDVTDTLEKILSPCQMSKLKYLLEGRSWNERSAAAACNYPEDDEQPKNLAKKFKNDRIQDPLFDLFQ